MDKLVDFNDKDKLENNQVYVNPKSSKIIDSYITFYGKNNILFVEDGVVLKHSNILFNKDNAVIYLSKNSMPYIIDCFVNHEDCIYIGKNCYFNDVARMHLFAYECSNIVIGDDGLFSFDIWMRTSDPHLIYDVNTKERINYSKSIFVGDHVWLGQRCMILKGSQIGSGSVVGGGGGCLQQADSVQFCMGRKSCTFGSSKCVFFR